MSVVVISTEGNTSQYNYSYWNLFSDDLSTKMNTLSIMILGILMRVHRSFWSVKEYTVLDFSIFLALSDVADENAAKILDINTLKKGF